jgi:hypothetical protein
VSLPVACGMNSGFRSYLAAGYWRRSENEGCFRSFLFPAAPFPSYLFVPYVIPARHTIPATWSQKLAYLLRGPLPASILHWSNSCLPFEHVLYLCSITINSILLSVNLLQSFCFTRDSPSCRCIVVALGHARAASVERTKSL